MSKEIKNFNVGNWESALLHIDTFGLDGGAMFGIIPKSLWNKSYDCDDKNRINLSGSLLYVNAGGQNIIVETGIGRKLSSKEEKIYKLKNVRTIEEALMPLDLTPEDIDYVILTHLHLDHAGGATKTFQNEVRPTFRNAKYIVQEKEYEAALNPNERTEGSYKKDDYVPLEEAGNLELVDGKYEIIEGVEVIRTGGHTIGHQVVLFENSEEKLLHIGDLVPTSKHLPLPHIMAYDTHPMKTLEQRKKWYEKSVEKDMKVVFPHDLNQTVADPSDFVKQLEKHKD